MSNKLAQQISGDIALKQHNESNYYARLQEERTLRKECQAELVAIREHNKQLESTTEQAKRDYDILKQEYDAYKKSTQQQHESDLSALEVTLKNQYRQQLADTESRLQRMLEANEAERWRERERQILEKLENKYAEQMRLEREYNTRMMAEKDQIIEKLTMVNHELLDYKQRTAVKIHRLEDQRERLWKFHRASMLQKQYLKQYKLILKQFVLSTYVNQRIVQRKIHLFHKELASLMGMLDAEGSLLHEQQLNDERFSMNKEILLQQNDIAPWIKHAKKIIKQYKLKNNYHEWEMGHSASQQGFMNIYEVTQQLIQQKYLESERQAALASLAQQEINDKQQAEEFGFVGSSNHNSSQPTDPGGVSPSGASPSPLEVVISSRALSPTSASSDEDAHEHAHTATHTDTLDEEHRRKTPWLNLHQANMFMRHMADALPLISTSFHAFFSRLIYWKLSTNSFFQRNTEMKVSLKESDEKYSELLLKYHSLQQSYHDLQSQSQVKHSSPSTTSLLQQQAPQSAITSPLQKNRSVNELESLCRTLRDQLQTEKVKYLTLQQRYEESEANNYLLQSHRLPITGRDLAKGWSHASDKGGDMNEMMRNVKFSKKERKQWLELKNDKDAQSHERQRQDKSELTSRTYFPHDPPKGSSSSRQLHSNSNSHANLHSNSTSTFTSPQASPSASNHSFNNDSTLVLHAIELEKKREKEKVDRHKIRQQQREREHSRGHSSNMREEKYDIDDTDHLADYLADDVPHSPSALSSAGASPRSSLTTRLPTIRSSLPAHSFQKSTANSARRSSNPTQLSFNEYVSDAGRRGKRLSDGAVYAATVNRDKERKKKSNKASTTLSHAATHNQTTLQQHTPPPPLDQEYQSTEM